jgi:hypothetical protein
MSKGLKDARSIAGARERAAQQRAADKKFVSWRTGCPWIHKSGMKHEMFKCEATGFKCRKINCAVMHLIERSKI